MENINLMIQETLKDNIKNNIVCRRNLSEKCLILGSIQNFAVGRQCCKECLKKINHQTYIKRKNLKLQNLKL
jgi:hypothetical protein